MPVGQLTQRRTADGARYRFVYLKSAEQQDEFTPLPGLPDIHDVYESSTLFPVFANRVMPRERPDYGQFLEQLDLALGSDPFEVLARSEGVRATDRVEVFSEPTRSECGDLTTLFFARGIRHRAGLSEAVDHSELAMNSRWPMIRATR